MAEIPPLGVEDTACGAPWNLYPANNVDTNGHIKAEYFSLVKPDGPVPLGPAPWNLYPARNVDTNGHIEVEHFNLVKPDGPVPLGPAPPAQLNVFHFLFNRGEIFTPLNSRTVQLGHDSDS